MKPYISNGSIEGLKWIGLVLMTLDHTNTILFNGKYSVMFELGRLVMPLFAFVLAYNLARTPKNEDVYQRVMKRLFIYGVIATPFFMFIHSSWYPLNIMFTLLTSTVCIYFIDKGSLMDSIFAMLIFSIGGVLAEYWYPAILFTIFSWQYCRSGEKQWLLLMLVMMFPIGVTNNMSMTGALSLIIIFAGAKINLTLPRAKYFFYVYYPLHLAILFCFCLQKQF